jgi:hypothetical protein
MMKNKFKLRKQDFIFGRNHKWYKSLDIYSHPFIWALFFNLLNIFIFTLLYNYYSDDFEFRGYLSIERKRKMTPYDLTLLAVTTQAGVGLTSVYPKSKIGTLLCILQQMIMIIGNITILYLHLSPNYKC